MKTNEFVDKHLDQVAKKKKQALKLFEAKQEKTLVLTKREYFTAKAMQAILSNPEWMKVYEKEKYLMQSQIVAEVAVSYADQVLAKLSSEEIE
jgi:hypothetical protein